MTTLRPSPPLSSPSMAGRCLSRGNARPTTELQLPPVACHEQQLDKNHASAVAACHPML